MSLSKQTSVQLYSQKFKNKQHSVHTDMVTTNGSDDARKATCALLSYGTPDNTQHSQQYTFTQFEAGSATARDSVNRF